MRAAALHALAVATAAGLAAGSAAAAGGHHAVDDAIILDPGQCELETWVTRGANGILAHHAGPGCRVGPVELSATFERVREAGARQDLASLQAKAVAALPAGWSVGAAIAPAWESGPRHFRGTTVLLLATRVDGPLTLHLNGGQDLLPRAAAQPRYGVAAEWALDAAWSLVAERFAERHSAHSRAGARWQLTPRFNLDLSHTRTLGSGPASWTLGATWQFDRRD